ncbi:MAG: hypothetical protein EOP53_02460 [Sphingobacteriales bacterium]|nr:MAG: hypothetical protein EOP53_02460 [Sphingobacteriales bacterium]
MRDRHILVPEDSQLLKLIHKQVNENLDLNNSIAKAAIIFKFIFYFSASSACYLALYTVKNPYIFTFCFVLYGFSMLLFAFNFAHDFSHGTVFKSRKLNSLCFIFIYTLVGAHAEAWKQRHITSHHFAPNVEDYDSDMEISNLIRVIPNSKYLAHHRFQHFYAPFAYMTYSLFWIFIKDFVLLFSADEFTKKKGLKYHVSFWLQKAVYFTYLLLLPLLFSPQEWYVVLGSFLLMHLLQSLFLLFTFFMTHHVEATFYPTTDDDGFITTSWLMNQIKSSNDFYPFSQFANFIFGGFNNHIAHHLFPHIHHIHYPKLNRILYKILQEHNITPNQTGFITGALSHLKLLQIMSRKDDISPKTWVQIVT